MTKVLAGDVGGTTTRLGVFEGGGPRPTATIVRTYRTDEFGGIPEMVATFLRDAGSRARAIDGACFGAAGPVIDGVARLTNAPVDIDASAIAKVTGIARVSLLNDLEALAYAVPVLADSQVRVLQPGRPAPRGTIALIAAGTGLGEAVLYDVDGRRVPKPSEAGRSDFAARSERDITVLRWLTLEYGRAAVEHVVSGIGLVHIHKALGRNCRAGVDFSAADAPAKISSSALERACPGCVDALDVFIEAYGAEAGNLALRTVATGGLYVGGGIAPKILDALSSGPFLAAFRSKPPFTSLLEAMPVNVILDEEAGLLGAACYYS